MHRYMQCMHSVIDSVTLVSSSNRLWLISPKILAFDWQIKTGTVSCKSLVSFNWYPTFPRVEGRPGHWVDHVGHHFLCFFHDFRETWTWCRVYGSQHGSEAGGDWDGKTDVLLLHPNIWSQGNSHSVQDPSSKVPDLFSKTSEIDDSCLASILA